MDLPECKEFKLTYDQCFEVNIKSKLSGWVFDPVAAQKCEEPFQNYKDCVEVVMRKKLADRHKK